MTSPFHRWEPGRGGPRPRPPVPDEAERDRGPVDAVPAGPRPIAVTVAAGILAAMGVALVVTTLVDLVGLVATVAGQDYVDGQSAILTAIMAGVAGAMLLAVIAAGAVQVVVAVRVARRYRWSWIEGCVGAVVGVAFALIALVSTDPGAGGPPVAELAVAGASLFGGGFIIVALLVHRPWFGRLYLPRRDEEAPFWLRRGFRQRLSGTEDWTNR